MATIPFRSSATNTVTSGSSIAVTKPSGLAVGDLMIAVLACDVGINTPTGWTSLGGITTLIHNAAFWKLADANDVAASSFTFTFTTSVGLGAAAGILAFQNPLASGPIDQYLNLDAASCTGITPTGSMGTIVMLASLFNGSGSTGSVAGYQIATDNPGTWTEAFDLGASSQKIGVAAAYASRPAPTATGTAQFTPTGYNQENIWIIYLSPGPIPALHLTGTFPTPIITNIDMPSLHLTATLNPPTFSEVVSKWLNTTKSAAASWLNQSKSP